MDVLKREEYHCKVAPRHPHQTRSHFNVVEARVSFSESTWWSVFHPNLEMSESPGPQARPLGLLRLQDTDALLWVRGDLRGFIHPWTSVQVTH